MCASRGVQIAREKGIKVIAIDTGPKKRALCIRLGATAFLDFKTDDIEASVKYLTNGYGAHAVVCPSVMAAYQQAMRLVRNTGTVVCVGLVSEDLPISPFEMLVRGLRIVGSSVGTPRHMDELLPLAVEGKVLPLVEVVEFDELDRTLHWLAKYEVEGRIVVKIPQ
ncbi:MAG: hypothetical protein ASARMPREDX12_004165 [Alectoria sarmentosa]|nr:MAG: hypothetical protein ASARMPREDX12_004165 [Alectoria sarmentosa]